MQLTDLLHVDLLNKVNVTKLLEAKANVDVLLTECEDDFDDIVSYCYYLYQQLAKKGVKLDYLTETYKLLKQNPNYKDEPINVKLMIKGHDSILYTKNYRELRREGYSIE